MPVPVKKLSFSRSQRLTHALEFQAVFAHKLRKSRGSITVFAMPNGLGHDRLGLSIGKRVGGAVVRGRAKKLIRESFRLTRAQRFELLGANEIGGGYDLVVTSRPHPGYATRRLKVTELSGWLLEAAVACHREQLKRDSKHAAEQPNEGSADV